MKKYIRPMMFWEEIEVHTSLLAGSGPEDNEVDGVMAKKNDFSFIDEEEENTSWPKSQSAWEK